MSHAAVVEPLRTALAGTGLDLVAAARAGGYDARVRPEWRLPPVPGLAPGAALVVLVGNSRALWPRFVAALRADAALLATAHPLDAYAAAAIGGALARLPLAPVDVRWAPDPPPRGVAMQALAEAAGLAWRSPAHLCVHPELGPWLGLRAALVFPVEGPEAVAPARPCLHCAEGCEPALAAARGAEDWRAWLAVRDACPTGRAQRYDADQIAYHYTKDRAILERCAGGPGRPAAAE